VLNKVDLLPGDEREPRCRALVESIGWTGPVFFISAAVGEGTRLLVQQVMSRLEELRLQQDEGAIREPDAPGEWADSAEDD
jgi:GTP-binding protein